jgi:hypothetical protein
LSKKSNAGGSILQDFRLFYRVIITKTALYWHKSSHIDQWNIIEDPEKKKAHGYSHLFFDKENKHKYWRKESLFNKSCWETWLSTHRRLKLDLYLSTHILKIKFKWMKDFVTTTEKNKENSSRYRTR